VYVCIIYHAKLKLHRCERLQHDQYSYRVEREREREREREKSENAARSQFYFISLGCKLSPWSTTFLSLSLSPILSSVVECVRGVESVVRELRPLFYISLIQFPLLPRTFIYTIYYILLSTETHYFMTL
jgi:hypothetical protein